jgi:hypothetical protein
MSGFNVLALVFGFDVSNISRAHQQTKAAGYVHELDATRVAGELLGVARGRRHSSTASIDGSARQVGCLNIGS